MLSGKMTSGTPVPRRKMTRDHRYRGCSIVQIALTMPQHKPNDRKHVEELIIRARAGDQSAAETLVGPDGFGPLIAKFVRICLRGTVNKCDIHEVRFLRYFARDSVPVEHVALMLKTHLRRYHSKDDLFRYGVLAMLESIRAGGNVAGSFPSFFSNHIDALIKDPLHNAGTRLECEIDVPRAIEDDGSPREPFYARPDEVNTITEADIVDGIYLESVLSSLAPKEQTSIREFLEGTTRSIPMALRKKLRKMLER